MSCICIYFLLDAIGLEFLAHCFPNFSLVDIVYGVVNWYSFPLSELRGIATWNGRKYLKSVPLFYKVRQIIFICL